MGRVTPPPRRSVAHAGGLRFPRIPYPVRIGRPADNQSGAVRPVNVPEAPTMSPAVRPLPLAVARVGYAARGYSACEFPLLPQADKNGKEAAIPPHAYRQGSPGRR